MKKLISIGEALIDFAPLEKGCRVKDVEHFMPKVGGAPANVCGAYNCLGGKSAMITMLGMDPFADKILEEFKKYHIDDSLVKRTDKANTSLAFVAIEENGNREFSFYRKMGADMLLEPEEVEESGFENSYALHFCSVSLGDFPMRYAHDRAIELARNNHMLVSFDPNIRLPLWDDHAKLRERVLEYMGKADVLKVSDEELEFITGTDSIEEALPKLFVGEVKLVIYTMGGKGAMAFTKTKSAVAYGKEMKAVDTTGAGDGFIGSFLYQLANQEVSVEMLKDLDEKFLEKALDFSNRFCQRSVMTYGAIASYPTIEEL